MSLSRTRSKNLSPYYEPGKRDPRFNAALARGISVLEAFQPDDDYLGNKELAARCGIPAATVSRLTYTLTELGYLNYAESLGKYCVSARLLSLGSAARSRFDVDLAARSLMQALARATNGVVGLGVLEQREVVVLDSVATEPAMTRFVPHSRAVPLLTSAMGWACLAALPESRRSEHVAQLISDSPKEWAKFEYRLKNALAEVWKSGFCVFTGALNSNWNVASAPFHHNGRIYAVNCSAPAEVAPEILLRERWGPGLVELTAKLRQNLVGVAGDGFQQEQAEMASGSHSL